MSEYPTARGFIEAPRWAGVPSYIKTAAHMDGLQCTVDVDKGWIRETVRWTVTGPQDRVEKFIREFDSALAAYKAKQEAVT